MLWNDFVDFTKISYFSAIRCPEINLKGHLKVTPNDCSTNGGEFNKICQFYCINGDILKGTEKIMCQQDGKYDLPPNATYCKEGIHFITHQIYSDLQQKQTNLIRKFKSFCRR